MDYKPPFTITNAILKYVASISEKLGKLNAVQGLENKPHLRKNNRIKEKTCIYSRRIVGLS